MDVAEREHEVGRALGRDVDVPGASSADDDDLVVDCRVLRELVLRTAARRLAVVVVGATRRVIAARRSSRPCRAAAARAPRCTSRRRVPSRSRSCPGAGRRTAASGADGARRRARDSRSNGASRRGPGVDRGSRGGDEARPQKWCETQPARSAEPRRRPGRCSEVCVAAIHDSASNVGRGRRPVAASAVRGSRAAGRPCEFCPFSASIARPATSSGMSTKPKPFGRPVPIVDDRAPSARRRVSFEHRADILFGRGKRQISHVDRRHAHVPGFAGPSRSSARDWRSRRLGLSSGLEVGVAVQLALVEALQMPGFPPASCARPGWRARSRARGRGRAPRRRTPCTRAPCWRCRP